MKPALPPSIKIFIIIIASLFFVGEGYGQGYIAASKLIGDSLTDNYNNHGGKSIMSNGEIYLLRNVYCDQNCPNTFGGSLDIQIKKLDINGDVIWIKYLGGSGSDEGADIKLYNGSLYIAGRTNSNNYPITNGSLFNDSAGVNPMYTKINANTGEIQFSTFINISAQAEYVNITNDYVFITGNIGSEVNYDPSASSSSYVFYHGSSIFVSKFNNNSNTLINTYVVDSCFLTDHYYDQIFTFSNYQPGRSRYPEEVEVSANNIYLTCTTCSSQFPVTNNSTFKGFVDMLYIKLNSTTGLINFASYFGGSNIKFFPFRHNTRTFPSKLKLYNGNLYILGYTNASDFPTTNASDGESSSHNFLTCIDGASNEVVFSKFIENSYFADDMDVQGDIVYLLTSSTNTIFPFYPVNNTRYGRVLENSPLQYDIEFMKFNAGTGEKVYSTFFFSPSDLEEPINMTVVNGEAYLLGITGNSVYFDTSTYVRALPSGFPITNGVSTYAGYATSTITKINSENKICFSAYFSGALGYYYTSNYLGRGNPKIFAHNNNIFVSGGTNSYHFPTTINLVNEFNDYVGWTKFTLTPTMSQGLDSLLPVAQPACKNGYANQITGQELFFPSSLMPILYTNGVASNQTPFPLNYQWQKSDAATGPWVNVPGATALHYSPPQLGLTNQYFRRQAYASICAPTDILSTSTVSAVLVNANTAPIISVNNSLNNCPSIPMLLGGTPTAVALGGASVTSYLWGPSSTTFTPSAAVANPIVTSNNSAIYSLQVMDNNGCKQIGYQLVNAHRANAGADMSSCAGSSVRIGTAPVPGLPAITYNWTANPADPTMSCTSCAQPTVHPLVQTNYILTMTVALQAGGTCSTTDTVLVKVVPAPIPAAFAGPDKTVCIGSTIPLGTTANVGFSYNWYDYLVTEIGYSLSNPNISNPNFTYINSIYPNPNPISIHLMATKDACIFEDEVKVNIIGASAGIDDCGPRVLGSPDPNPSVPKTFLWSVVSGTGHILGANNTAQINVGASVGANVVYRLTVTTNGFVCTDEVVVPVSCGGGGGGGGVDPNGCQYPTINLIAPNTCANFNANNGNVKLVAHRTIPTIFTWSPAAGLSNTVGDTVSLTDNVPRTYTVTATSPIDPTNFCTSTKAVNNPVVIPVFVANHVVSCPNVPVSIGQVSVAGFSYLWEDPIGYSLNSDTISNPTATVPYTTYYPVKVTSSSGCTVRDTASVTVVDFPQDIAGNDLLLCDTNVAQLGLPPSPLFAYTWSGAASFIPNNTVANLKVIVNATTTFVLVATNLATGCTITDSVKVIVGAPVAAFSLAAVNYCPSAGAIPMPAGPTGMASYNWSPNNLVQNPTSNGPVATTLVNPPTIPTTYTLQVTNTAGCRKSASVLFTPNAISPVAGTSRSICKNATTQIGAAPQAGVYTWIQIPTTGGSLNSYNISNPVFTSTATGTYKFIVSKLTAGCVTKDSVTITVTEFTLPVLVSPVVCQNTCVQIGTTSPFAGTQYFWSPTTGLNDATISNPVACVTTTSQQYTLTAVGVNGCTASQNMFVTVNPSPSHTVTIPPIAACIGATGLTLNPVVSPAGSYNYLWTGGNGLSNIYASNPAVSITATGTKNYSVLVTNNTTGCATTATTTVTGTPCPLPIKLESFTAAPQDKTVLLTWVVSEEINVLKYEIEFSTDGRNFWSIGSRVATNSKTYNLVHNSPVFGINYYRLKTVDNDGKISYSEVRTVNFKLTDNVTVYPNPVNDLLHITFSAASINKSATISVIAMDGKKIYEKNISKLSQTETLDVSKLANGCYIIRILTNAEVINKSVVVYK
jgi:hypothetical protein